MKITSTLFPNRTAWCNECANKNRNKKLCNACCDPIKKKEYYKKNIKQFIDLFKRS